MVVRISPAAVSQTAVLRGRTCCPRQTGGDRDRVRCRHSPDNESCSSNTRMGQFCWHEPVTSRASVIHERDSFAGICPMAGTGQLCRHLPYGGNGAASWYPFVLIVIWQADRCAAAQTAIATKGFLMETSVLYLCLYCQTGQNTPVRGKNRLNRDIWRATKVWDYMMTIGIVAQRRF